MSTEKFKGLASQTSLDQQGLDHQSYSQHLGRAEFDELRRNRKTSTSSAQGITSPTLSGGSMNQQQSRDSSNERPASAMARMAASGMDYSIFFDLAPYFSPWGHSQTMLTARVWGSHQMSMLLNRNHRFY